MKKVTVYTPTGKNFKEFNTEATTWGALQPQLGENQISYSGMKAVIGETRLTMESNEAALPETDFTLFLMPVKVKSGSERSDLFEKIKAFVGKDEKRKALFIIDGKNMTQISTEKLKELAAKHIGGTTSPAIAPAEKKESKTNVADVVESVGKAKAGAVSAEEALVKAKEGYKKAVAADADEDVLDMWLEKIAAAKKALAAAPTAPAAKEEPKETEAQRIAREAAEAQKAKVQDLDKQARSIASGFKDLKSFS